MGYHSFIKLFITLSKLWWGKSLVAQLLGVCLPMQGLNPLPHLAKRWEPRGFSRGAAAFSTYDGDLSLPLGLALGSPIFPSGCEGKLGVALESLQGLRDLT